MGFGRRQHALNAGFDDLTLSPEPGIVAVQEPATELLTEVWRHLDDLLAHRLDLLLLGVLRDLNDLDRLPESSVRKPHARCHSGHPPTPTVYAGLPWKWAV